MELSQKWAWSSVGNFICSNFLPASGGSLPHVAKLIDEFLFDFFHQRVLQEACERGASVYELEFILERTAPVWKEVVKSVIRGGHLHVFEWMIELQDNRGPWRAYLSYGILVAAEYGRLHFFTSLVGKLSSCDGFRAVKRAARNGHLEVLKWLHKHNKCDGCHYVLIDAAENGHLDIMQWLPNYPQRLLEIQPAMMYAAGNGHLEILQWLHQSCSEACSSVVMDKAAGGGHLHVVQWLLENCTKGCSSHGIYLAAGNGNLVILRWLNEHFSSQFDTHAMDNAAGNNQLEVVKWLHSNRSEGCTTQAMDNAAWNGDLETIKWLHANRNEGCTTQAMNWAARNGHLHVVGWLHENRSEGCTFEAMNEAVRRDHLDVVRFLSENRTKGCSVRAVQDAAWAGHLEMVQYLDHNRCARQYASWWGMGETCERGRLELLLYLVKNYTMYQEGYIHSGYRTLIQRFCSEIMDELLAQSEANMPAMENKIFRSLDRYDIDIRRLDLCVAIMLDTALRRGCRRFVQRILEHRDQQRRLQLVEVAGKYEKRVLLRWMIENAVDLDAVTCTNLVQQCKGYTNLTGVLGEADRIAVVFALLQKDHHAWFVVWILNNTNFTGSSRVVISKALNNVSSAAYICERLNDEIRSWCFPSDKEAEQ